MWDRARRSVDKDIQVCLTAFGFFDFLPFVLTSHDLFAHSPVLFVRLSSAKLAAQMAEKMAAQMAEKAG